MHHTLVYLRNMMLEILHHYCLYFHTVVSLSVKIVEGT